MAVLDFPSSPTTGDQYVGDNGAIYVYDTNRWKLFTPQVNLAETVQVEVFTADGTWNKPSGLIYATAEVVSGGGAGGGPPATTASQAAAGNGGSGGGYSRKQILATDLGATETVTVGAAGAGASGTTGGSGGTSSFGSHASATGGTGGTSQVGAQWVSNGTQSAPGIGSSGDVNIPGSVGHLGYLAGTSAQATAVGYGGGGGSSFYGGGGTSVGGTSSGSVGAAPGGGYGGGGGGGYNAASQSARLGGAGTAGVVIVTSHIAAPRAAAGLLVTGGVGQSVLFTASTTDATQTDMTYGGDGDFVVPAQTAVGFEAYITARDTGSDDAKAWTIKGLISRDNASATAIVGSVSKETIGEDAGATTWDATIEADDTSETLVIKVTGEAATTISWRATMMFNSDNGNLSVGVTNTDDIGVLQIVEATPYTTYTSTTASIAYDDTIPQSSEGTALPNEVTITPKSSASRLVIEAEVPMAQSASGHQIVALFQDSDTDALSAVAEDWGGTGAVHNVRLSHEMASGTTSATTFKLRYGGNAGTVYVNGSNTARKFGGAMGVKLRVTEYLADNQILSNTILQTGALVQEIEATPHTTYGTTTTTIPLDDTIPQNTEGVDTIGAVALPTVSITPTSSTNRLVIEMEVPCTNSGSPGVPTVALFQDSTAGALASAYESVAGGELTILQLRYEMEAGTTSETTFKMRVGPHVGTFYLNGSNSNRLHGGIVATRMRVREIKA